MAANRRFPYAVPLGALTAFPGFGKPGDIYLGETGAIAREIAIVGADGIPIPLVSGGGGQFVPTDDNLTDLGDATHRFRTLYLGTSLTNSANLVIDLTGGATRTLAIRNSTGGQVTNVTVDGSIAPEVDNVSDFGDISRRFRSLWLGTSIVGTGSLLLEMGNVADTTLTVANSLGGVANISVDGSVSLSGTGDFQALTGRLVVPTWAFTTAATIDITNAGASTLSILNSTANQVCNVSVDGSVTAASLSATTDDATNNAYTTLQTLTHTTSGVPAAGIGARSLYRAESLAGTVTVGSVGGQLTVVTGAAEVGALELVPAFAGTLATAGLRVRNPQTLSVNGVEALVAATGTGATLAAYGGDTNVALAVNAKGAAEVTHTREDAVTADLSIVTRLTHASSGAPANGLAAALGFAVENNGGAGATALAGVVVGRLTNVTAGGENGVLEMLPAFGGALAGAGLRVSNVGSNAPNILNGWELRPIENAAALTTGIVIRPYAVSGGAADVNANLAPLGVGSFNLRNALNTITVFGCQNVDGADAFGFAAESPAASTANGPVTISGVSGRFRLNAGEGTGGTVKVVTNNRVLSSASKVVLMPRRFDVTALSIIAIAAAGSFTVSSVANATADTDVDFFVINPAT